MFDATRPVPIFALRDSIRVGWKCQNKTNCLILTFPPHSVYCLLRTHHSTNSFYFIVCRLLIINVGENRQLRKDNPETLATLGTQDTGNTRYTRHRTKTNKAKNTTQKSKKMSNTVPTGGSLLVLQLQGICVN